MVTWTPESLQADGPRYLALVARIQRDVAEGRLAAGAQLPPQREVAARLGLDLTTVARAYAEAGRRGLVIGHVGRGTFVRPNAAAVGLARNPDGAPVVDLSLNLPAATGIEEAERALAGTLRTLAAPTALAGLLEYQPSAGRAEHRAAGAAWVEPRGVRAPAERVIVCSGAQHALTVLLSVLVPAGGTVFTECLTYPVFKVLAEQLHVCVHGLPTDRDGLLVEPFRAACAAGIARVLYCTPTLQNPTAALMSLARRREIAAVAREHDVLIIEDDVYGMLPRRAAPALSSFAPERSFFVASLSKAVAPGLRVAFVVAPDERGAKQVAAGVRATAWMATPLTAEVASIWIRDGVAARLLAANRSEANVRQGLAIRYLGQFPWHAHPESYHGWLELPTPWSSAEFVMQARRHGIVVTPSDAFHVGPDAAPAAVRLSLCAGGSRADVERALDRLARVLDTGPEVGLSIL